MSTFPKAPRFHSVNDQSRKYPSAEYTPCRTTSPRPSTFGRDSRTESIPCTPQFANSSDAGHTPYPNKVPDNAELKVLLCLSWADGRLSLLS